MRDRPGAPEHKVPPPTKRMHCMVIFSGLTSLVHACVDAPQLVELPSKTVSQYAVELESGKQAFPLRYGLFTPELQ